MIKFWTNITTALSTNSVLRVLALAIYYVAIVAGLVLLYGKSQFVVRPFVYQGF